jgi:hypothetical protein
LNSYHESINADKLLTNRELFYEHSSRASDEKKSAITLAKIGASATLATTAVLSGLFFGGVVTVGAVFAGVASFGAIPAALTLSVGIYKFIKSRRNRKKANNLLKEAKEAWAAEEAARADPNNEASSIPGPAPGLDNSSGLSTTFEQQAATALRRIDLSELNSESVTDVLEETTPDFARFPAPLAPLSPSSPTSLPAPFITQRRRGSEAGTQSTPEANQENGTKPGGRRNSV